jgi:hypothetical protein
MLSTIDTLSVRTSQTVGFPLRRADGSYTVSMRCHGLPDRQNVHRCIRVSVVGRATFRARPFPHAQRQFLYDMSAGGAGLRGREPSVDLDHGFAVPLGLFFDHADGRSDGCVVQRAGKAVVLGHAAQVEVFDADHIETGNEIGAQLVQRITAAVGNLLVDAGNMTLDFLAPLAALLRPGKALLIERQPTLPLGAVFRIADALAVAQCGEPRNTKVDTNRFARFGQRRRLSFHHQRHEVFAAGRANQTNRGRMRDRLARPLDLDRADLGELENAPLRVERESALGVVGRLARILSLELRVACALGEEVGKRDLQVTQGLLQADAGHLVQPDVFRRCLQRRKRLVGFRVAHTLTGAERICASTKCPVPDEPHAAERPRKMLLLLGRRVAAECPSGFHVSHFSCAVCEKQLHGTLRVPPYPSPP